MPCGELSFDRVLGQLSADRSHIVRHLNQELSRHLDRSATSAFCHVTSCTFERGSGDEVPVWLALVVDEQGFPMDYDLCVGSPSDFGAVLPLIARLKSDCGLSNLVVVADCGQIAPKHIQQLTELGCDFVIAQKIGNCTGRKKEVIWDDENWRCALRRWLGHLLQDRGWGK